MSPYFCFLYIFKCYPHYNQQKRHWSYPALPCVCSLNTMLLTQTTWDRQLFLQQKEFNVISGFFKISINFMIKMTATNLWNTSMGCLWLNTTNMFQNHLYARVMFITTQRLPWTYGHWYKSKKIKKNEIKKSQKNLFRTESHSIIWVLWGLRILLKYQGCK